MAKRSSPPSCCRLFFLLRVSYKFLMACPDGTLCESTHLFVTGIRSTQFFTMHWCSKGASH